MISEELNCGTSRGRVDASFLPSSGQHSTLPDIISPRPSQRGRVYAKARSSSAKDKIRSGTCTFLISTPSAFLHEICRLEMHIDLKDGQAENVRVHGSCQHCVTFSTVTITM